MAIKHHMVVPTALYNLMMKEAKRKKQTFKQYQDELAMFLMFGEFDV